MSLPGPLPEVQGPGEGWIPTCTGGPSSLTLLRLAHHLRMPKAEPLRGPQKALDPSFSHRVFHELNKL